MPRGLKWLEGDVFGKLTVWQYLGRGARGAMWHCQCECGNLRVVTGPDLRKGRVTDCGQCYEKDESLHVAVQELRAPCDEGCHYRGLCMTEKLACWPFEMWVKHGEEHKPDPESFAPTEKIYKRIFKNG